MVSDFKLLLVILKWRLGSVGVNLHRHSISWFRKQRTVWSFRDSFQFVWNIRYTCIHQESYGKDVYTHIFKLIIRGKFMLLLLSLWTKYKIKRATTIHIQHVSCYCILWCVWYGTPYRVWMLSVSPPSPHFRWKVLLSHTSPPPPPQLQREKILTNESGTNSRELFLFHAEYCGNPGTLSVYIGLIICSAVEFQFLLTLSLCEVGSTVKVQTDNGIMHPDS